MTDNNNLRIINYAAAFIDLLGQKEALGGCSLVPTETDEQSRQKFLSEVKATIGSIAKLHKHCTDYFDAFTNYRGDQVKSLPPDALKEYEKMRTTNLKFQRFSDGLVAYVGLGEAEIHYPMISVTGLIAACGSLCLLGLASGTPVRVGIEVAWGAELNANELYGCVIAKAHELESKVAGYPRVVVGDQLIHYLNSYIEDESITPQSNFNKTLSDRCLEMLAVDYDGYHIVDYLGKGYKQYSATAVDAEVFNLAEKFVLAQMTKWREAKRSELALRYTLLASYFEHNKANWINNT